LLTDEDLNRLDHYITAKQRLHNRYLHGWGVVCGLEVVCHPCEGYVTVRSGYALSPCGEDIIVCKDDVVNICELIQRCRDRDRAYECEPLRPYSTADCQDLEEEWILTICYDERATRGMMAVRSGASSGSCARCNCGGASGCGCGCHEKSNGHGHTSRKTARPAPAQCEPTVTCETYGFTLRRPPVPQKTDQRRQGELVQRVLCCLQELYQSLPQPPTREQGREAWRRWCCEVKTVFLELFARHGLFDCQLDERLAAFHCPDPQGFESDTAYIQAVTQAVQRLATVLAEYLRACYCSVLLPPCPPPAEDNCVPLASIRVRRSDCHILRVCTLDFRRIAITLPALQYWLSLLPLGDRLRQLLARLCCQPFRTEQVQVDRFQRATVAQPTPFARTSAAGVDATAFATHEQELTHLAAQAWANRTNPVNPYTLLLDTLGAVDAQGQPLLSTLERRNPVEAVLLNQLILPLIDDFLPGAKGEGAPRQPAPAAEVQSAEAVSSELTQLREIVEKQRQIVETLQQEVNKLKKKRGSG
jgi:hypothetical protein